MFTLLQAGITNALVASLLATIVFGATRRWRAPAVAHVLWLLVLVKLLMPPLVSLPLPILSTAYQVLPGIATPERPVPPQRSTDAASKATEGPASGSASSAARRNAPAIDSTTAPASSRDTRTETTDTLPQQKSFGWVHWIMAAWLLGSIIVLASMVRRIVDFYGLVRETCKAPVALQQLADSVRSHFQLAATAEVRVTSICIPPLVWSLGRRKLIVLPASLVQQLDQPSLETVLAHELAHIKRRDHFVRWVELAAIIIYWWLPTVWWVKRQLREAEEAACDAWVVEALPHRKYAYATALVQAVETLVPRRPALPVVASGFGEGRQLIRRIERLAEARPPRIGWVRMLMLVLAAVVVLPVSPKSFAVEDHPLRTEVGWSGVDDAEPAPAPGPAVEAAADPLGKELRQSIQQGVDFLKVQQDEAGNWSDPIGFEGGVTALCTLGLLEAGVQPDEAAVAKALAWLREHHEPQKTYVVSLVTRVYAAAGLPEDHGRIKRNANWLANIMIEDGPYRGCWGYQQDAGEGDNSNSQYAMLGLHAAESAGIDVPERVWHAARAYWVAAQNNDGSWGYKPNVTGTGSMTAAGVTSLAIALARGDLSDRDDDREAAEKAVDRAFEWLAEHYSVEGNPVPAMNRVWQRWHYYYLTALMYGCRYASRDQIGDHDFRRDVVELLLDEQQQDGSWRGNVPEDEPPMATAFALLALSASVQPGAGAVGATAPADAPVREPFDPENIVSGILERADALHSGRFRYHVEAELGDKILRAGEREFCFSGEQWIERNLSASSWRVNYDGRRLEYREHKQPDGSTRRTLDIKAPHPDAFEHQPHPPTYLGTLWRGTAIREYLRHRSSEARYLGEDVLDGVRCQILEWKIGPEQVSAFGAMNDLLRHGGALRLYCAPTLGFALPRIEKIDPFGTVQARYDSAGFSECEDGIWFPGQAEIVHGTYHVRYKLDVVDLVNQDIPRAVFLPAIPGGTRVADTRPHVGDKIDEDGRRRIDLQTRPFRQFTTGAPYPNGLPQPLLEEMDREVIAQSHED